MRLTGMRKLLPVAAAAAVVAIVLAVAAVAHTGHDEKPTRSDGPSDAEQLWTGTAPLLQTPDGKLTLCGGVTLTSLPPAGCGGAAVRGLDPMTVPGAERFPNGTITTPSVRLTGTWDGTALTVTEPADPAQPPTPAPDAGVPPPSCAEPAGGWPYDRVDQAGWGRVREYAESQLDAGSVRIDASQRILTVPFTGDLDRHRTDIAELYDGPVCVELAEHSDKELQSTFERAQADLKARGLPMLMGHGGQSTEPFAAITVVAVSPKEKAEIEAAYDGMLRLTSFLQLVNRD